MKCMVSDRDSKRIRNACGLVYQATRSIRILTQISWPNRVREKFFAQGENELPDVKY